jgi:VIT1/CCC1 family predicted Fe2+/Mn2+ transporter
MNNILLNKILLVQKSEITEYTFYQKIAEREKNTKNKEILNHIADVEMTHYRFWQNLSKVEVFPNLFRFYFYYIIVILFGLTFGIRLMEKKNKKIKYLYEELNNELDGIEYIISDENEHEKMHIDEIDEARLKYISSIVLGLNDALVEFTGALAGFTFALGNNKIIALSGLIAGISAALSMASSEYLATKQEANHKFAFSSALYTGCAYLVAVTMMVLPYILIKQVYIALGLMLVIVVFIIFLFNYYISIAKELSFKKRFSEMVTISLGVAFLSFLLGLTVREFFGIDI